MQEFEQKLLVVVGEQLVKIKLVLRLEREGVDAIPAPDRQASTAICALVEHTREVLLYLAPRVWQQGSPQADTVLTSGTCSSLCLQT